MAEGLPTLRKAKYAITHGRMIGKGSYRKVFRTQRSRWVYKVNQFPNIHIGSNAEEWRTYQKFSSIELPEGVKIPEMHYLPGGIIAAEYVKGVSAPTDCYRDYHDEDCENPEICWAERLKNVQISDIACDNVVIQGDVIYIIDLGHGDSYR